MPYRNEHSARLQDPDMPHIRVRRAGGKMGQIDLPEGVEVIWYIVEGEDGGEHPVAQAIRFDKDKFTAEEAEQWLKDHNIEYLEFEPASETAEMARKDEGQGIKTEQKEQATETATLAKLISEHPQSVLLKSSVAICANRKATEEDRLHLFALVEWTDEAWELIRDQGFRYISAAYDTNYLDIRDGNSVGACLLGIGLTNTPFIPGLAPIDPESAEEVNGRKRCWVDVIYAGEWLHPEYGVLTITPDILRQMLENFNARVLGTDPPVDFQHRIHMPEPGMSVIDSRAAGWIKELKIEGHKTLVASRCEKCNEEIKAANRAQEEAKLTAPELEELIRLRKERRDAEIAVLAQPSKDGYRLPPVIIEKVKAFLNREEGKPILLTKDQSVPDANAAILRLLSDVRDMGLVSVETQTITQSSDALKGKKIGLLGYGPDSIPPDVMERYERRYGTGRISGRDICIAELMLALRARNTELSAEELKQKAEKMVAEAE